MLYSSLYIIAFFDFRFQFATGIVTILTLMIWLFCSSNGNNAEFRRLNERRKSRDNYLTNFLNFPCSILLKSVSRLTFQQ